MKCRNRWDSEHPNHLLLHLPKPNKAEIELNRLLQRYFPNEWEYTGDGKVIINGLVPDFTNKDGRKAVIELFGDYWHTKGIKSWKDTELGKIMVYKALGFESLIIWESELKDEQRVIAKIETFYYQKNKNSRSHIE
jgi:G:T-mismatch repair DNA endonuclease (very short patch repair protein)